MEFREAVDALTGTYTQAEIAKAIGVSYHSVRQALLPGSSAAHRSPPEGWEAVIARLARERARELERLARELEAAP